MKALTLEELRDYAPRFLVALSRVAIRELYGVTDGKAVGTFVEARFHNHLAKRYRYVSGSAAADIDFPKLKVDLKVTSLRQPQSSSPFTDASEKVYGLGHHLLVFVYEKRDVRSERAAILRFKHALFIDKSRTGDYQTAKGLRGILERDGNLEDVVAFLEERNLWLGDRERAELAERILTRKPAQGVLTVSNALQWRLQYGRAIKLAGSVSGVTSIL